MILHDKGRKYGGRTHRECIEHDGGSDLRGIASDKDRQGRSQVHPVGEDIERRGQWR